MNQFTEEELRRNLPKMTEEESRREYEELCEVWEHTQKYYPDPQGEAMLDQRHIQYLVERRRLWDKIARGLAQKEREIHRYLTRKKISYVFIGGVAVQKWGQPRFTKEVDLTIPVPVEEAEKFIERITQKFKGRITDLQEFARQTRVVLIYASNGRDVDISLALHMVNLLRTGKQIPPIRQRFHLRIRHKPRQHPETTIRMDVTQALHAE
jgi:hypothetical protein